MCSKLEHKLRTGGLTLTVVVSCLVLHHTEVLDALLCHEVLLSIRTINVKRLYLSPVYETWAIWDR